MLFCIYNVVFCLLYVYVQCENYIYIWNIIVFIVFLYVQVFKIFVVINGCKCVFIVFDLLYKIVY